MSADLYIYYGILLTVAIISIWYLKRLSLPFKILAILQVLVFCSECIARVLAIVNHNSYPPYHFLIIIQYWAYACIYSRLLHGRASTMVWRSAFIFTGIWLINFLFFQHLFEFPSNTIMLSFVLYIGFSLLLFMQMLREPEQVGIFRQGVFWFNCAVLVYSTAIPVCFGALNYLIKYHYDTTFLQNFIEYSAFAYYGVIGLALWLDARRKEGADA